MLEYHARFAMGKRFESPTKRNSVPHSKTLARWSGCPKTPPGFVVRRACAAFDLPRGLPILVRREFVRHLNTVCFKPVKAPDHCGTGCALKPAGRTPRILICNQHKTVSDWVLMHVIQPRQVGLLECETGIPEIVPDLAARRSVQPINPACAFGMER